MPGARPRPSRRGLARPGRADDAGDRHRRPRRRGKSTVAKALAERLGLRYLDTGAMYRGVTFAALRRGIDPEDVEPSRPVGPRLELEVGRRHGARRRDGCDLGDSRARGDAGRQHRGRQPGGASRAPEPPAGVGAPTTAASSRAATSARWCSRTPTSSCTSRRRRRPGRAPAQGGGRPRRTRRWRLRSPSATPSTRVGSLTRSCRPTTPS